MNYFDNPGGMIPTWLVNWAAKVSTFSFIVLHFCVCSLKLHFRCIYRSSTSINLSIWLGGEGHWPHWTFTDGSHTKNFLTDSRFYWNTISVSVSCYISSLSSTMRQRQPHKPMWHLFSFSCHFMRICTSVEIDECTVCFLEGSRTLSAAALLKKIKPFKWNSTVH